MKRTFAALSLLIALAPLPAPAQSSIVAQIVGDSVATEKLYFSLKFGLDFSYLTGLAEQAERSGGFNVGLSATIRLNDRLSLAPEITPFFRKGVAGIAFTTTGDPALDGLFAEPAASDLALEYIEIPVLLKYRFGRIHLGAGPYVGFLVSAKESFRAEPEEGEAVRYEREVTDAYRKTDFGFAAEASWTITKPRRGVGLILHGRYEQGLLDVLETPAPSGAVRNSVWHFYASFPFVF